MFTLSAIHCLSFLILDHVNTQTYTIHATIHLLNNNFGLTSAIRLAIQLDMGQISISINLRWLIHVCYWLSIFHFRIDLHQLGNKEIPRQQV